MSATLAQEIHAAEQELSARGPWAYTDYDGSHQYIDPDEEDEACMRKIDMLHELKSIRKPDIVEWVMSGCCIPEDAYADPMGRNE